MTEHTLSVEDHGPVLLARYDGPPHGLVGPDLAEQLAALVDRATDDPGVRAVVLTGAHPDRFIAHADVRWLQEGGAASPKAGPGLAGGIARAGAAARRLGPESVVSRTPLWGAVQLDKLHDTLLRMNTSGAVFVAALNGSALGLGHEIALACDLRIAADGDHQLGQPEILLGFNPGGGGTQRLPRLVGNHRALLMVLEGKALTPAEALEAGTVDAVVPADQLIDTALARAAHLGARDKAAVAACKRAIYLGGSATLPEGLHAERREFLSVLTGHNAQAVMRAYLDDTDTSGDLPLYDTDAYAAALSSGSFPAMPTTGP